MRVLVGIKRVIDSTVKARVKPDGSDVETHNVKMSINPFDEIAVEEAIRLKEQGLAKEILVASIGNDACQETLRHALALGADRGILIKTDKPLEPLHVAKIFKAIVNKEQSDFVILGKQAIDDDNAQTGQMLAALLDWPQATFASKIEITENTATITREVDAGLETISVKLPAVVTTDLRLNEPRYITLPNIMKAKQKPIETIALTELGLSLKTHQETIKVSAPKTRKPGKIVENFEVLLDILKNEAKVL